MKLTQEHLISFKKIYREQFGKDLTDAEASDNIRRLVRLYELILPAYYEDQRMRHIARMSTLWRDAYAWKTPIGIGTLIELYYRFGRRYIDLRIEQVILSYFFPGDLEIYNEYAKPIKRNTKCKRVNAKRSGKDVGS